VLIRVVNSRDGATETAADVQDRLAARDVCEIDHHLIETLLRAGKVAIVAVAPISEVNGALRETAAISVDQAVEVRWEQRIYPQQ
jgi:hypothetical protein